MNTNIFLEKAIALGWEYGPKTLAALALLFGGLWIIRRLSNGFELFLKARKVDEGLRPFFTSLVDTGLKIALILMVAGMVGIATTSFIAIFSAIAFSVGLALQGSLGNFASGVLILLFRPFKVGDFLTVADKSGKVAEIQIFSTILKTPSGKKIIIPNGKMTEGPIENIADSTEVQAEITLLLHGSTALDKVQVAAQEAAAKCPFALPDRAIEVKVAGITRDDMKTQVAVWTMGQHYEETLNHFYEALRSSFQEAGIELAKERRKETV